MGKGGSQTGVQPRAPAPPAHGPRVWGKRTLLFAAVLSLALLAATVLLPAAFSVGVAAPSQGGEPSPQAGDDAKALRHSWLGDFLVALGRVLSVEGERIARESADPPALGGSPAQRKALDGVAEVVPLVFNKASEQGLYAALGMVYAAAGVSHALWSTPAATAPLVVLGILWFRRRSIPSVSLSGMLYNVAAVHGLPPPILQPLLRIASMCLLSLALIAPLAFHALLASSTGLMAASIFLGLKPAPRRRALARKIPGVRLLGSSPLATLAVAQMASPGRRGPVMASLAIVSGLTVLALTGALQHVSQVQLATAALLLLAAITILEVLLEPEAGQEDWESALGEVMGVTIVDSGLDMAAHSPASGLSSHLLPTASTSAVVMSGERTSRATLFLAPGGNDPEDRREYIPGDDLRAIDWRATARSGKTITRLSPANPETSLWFLVDCSASTRAGIAASKQSIMSLLCSQTARAASAKDFRIGLALFTTDIEKLVPAQVGKRQSDRVAVVLRRFVPRGRGTDMPKALESLGKRLKGPGRIFLVSDFSEALSPPLQRSLKALREKGQEIVAVRVMDPLDEELPSGGVVCVENPETGDARLVDTADPELLQVYRASAQALQADLRRKLEALGVPFVQAWTTDPVPKLARPVGPPQPVSRPRQIVAMAATAC